jgi:hypothetical protein
MKTPMLPFVVAVSLALAGAARAQPAPDRYQVFAAAHFGPNWDDLYSESRRIPGAVLEGGLSFGLESARSGIEVDVSVPGAWHAQENPIHRFRYAGQTSGYLQKDHFYESTSTIRRRSWQVGLLYRRNVNLTGVNRVTLTWLVGGAAAYRPEESVGITNEVMPDGGLVEVNRTQGRSDRNYPAGVAGLEAVVKLSAHLAIVPRLRVTAYPFAILDDSGSAPRLLIAHPQIAFRWTF